MRINISSSLWVSTLFTACTLISGTTYATEYNGPEISFEQIFLRPEDNDLKLNYARQQMDAGDYLSAAGMLEGMLFTQPNWDTARLLYAIVLFKLDDNQAAAREFSLLENRPLSSEQRNLANSYQKQTTREGGVQKQGVQFSGGLEIGVRSDSNAGNTLFETPFIVANQSDTSAFTGGTLRVSAPLFSTGSRLKIHADLQGQTRRHSTFSTSDYDVLSGGLGISGDIAGIDWRADFKADNLYISGDKYLTQMGPKLTVGTKISDATHINLTGAAYYQDFEDTSFSITERFRSGNKYQVSAALLSRPTESLSYGGFIGYESKMATTRFLRYKGVRLGTHIRNEFDNGVYVKANANLRLLNYGALNLFAAPPTERDDQQFNGRVNIGASLNKIGRLIGMEASPALENTFMEGGLHYTNLNSNITIFEYNNFGAELKLLWNF